MRWVEQERSNTTDGDCLRSCLASITGLDDIPNLIEADDWFIAFYAWLNEHGWTMYARPSSWVATEPAVALVSSPTFPGFAHAVVVLGDQVIWDPSPHRNEPGRVIEPPFSRCIEVLRSDTGAEGAGTKSTPTTVAGRALLDLLHSHFPSVSDRTLGEWSDAILPIEDEAGRAAAERAVPDGLRLLKYDPYSGGSWLVEGWALGKGWCGTRDHPTAQVALDALRTLLAGAGPAPEARCPSCGGRRWVDDENWTPDDPRSWDGTRRPEDQMMGGRRATEQPTPSLAEAPGTAGRRQGQRQADSFAPQGPPITPTTVAGRALLTKANKAWGLDGLPEGGAS